MIVLGLTGSIGMGKTTTARLFADAGAAVYDADAAVQALYQAGGAAGPALKAAFPEAVADDGSVRRDALKAALARDPSRLAELESVVFPLLAQRREAFYATARHERRALAVLDIPLLYETGGEAQVDAVVLATTTPEIQRTRVLARETMTEPMFELLNARQLADHEKRRRADFLVDTGHGIDDARRQVLAISDIVLAPGWRPRSAAPAQGGPDQPSGEATA